MSGRPFVRFRFIDVDSFNLWKGKWFGDNYEYNVEFDELGSLEWHTATLDEFPAGNSIWEVMSNKTGKIIDTPRVAVLQDNMNLIEFEYIDVNSVDPAIEAKLEKLVETIKNAKEEIEEIVSSGYRLSYDKFNEINKILGK
ncbi:hypothetical protein JNEOFJEA_00256 [Aeromonas phage UP87]|nr:hypothetical protein JNEOFJEA_00256 [Aeromonas phage UP87]UYD59844.1 hypothetical protein LEHPIFIF_00071 [Aeromonas phage avDM9-HANS]